MSSYAGLQLTRFESDAIRWHESRLDAVKAAARKRQAQHTWIASLAEEDRETLVNELARLLEGASVEDAIEVVPAVLTDAGLSLARYNARRN